MAKRFMAKAAGILFGALVSGAVSLPTAPTAASVDLATLSIRTNLEPLQDPRTWVLRGKKLEDGSCRYRYDFGEREVPPGGWVIRSIAVDMSNCTKVMEEGSPVTILSPEMILNGAVSATSQSLATLTMAGGGAQTLAASSTRGAWQIVSWLDLASAPTSRTKTQIRWTYNGTAVLSGNASGTWWFLDFTGWRLAFKDLTQKFEADGSFRGQTRATYENGTFCGSSNPMVFTFINHNRVWGHKNGTATIAQSSDTVNDCLPLHVDITTGYN